MFKFIGTSFTKSVQRSNTLKTGVKGRKYSINKKNVTSNTVSYVKNIGGSFNSINAINTQYQSPFLSNLITRRYYSTDYPSHTVIDFPSLSPTMETGSILEWYIKEGDSISAGDALCQVETDKAKIDFSYEEDGFLAKILLPAGTRDIEIGRAIGIFVDDEGDIAAFKDYTHDSSNAAPAAAIEAPKETPAASSTPAQQNTQSTPTPASSSPIGQRIIASPLAKSVASQQGVNLSGLSGTGPNNRIIAADVREATTSNVNQQATPVTQTVFTPATSGEAYVDIPVTQIRKVTAKRLTESKQTIPHYYLTINFEVDKLMNWRKELNSQSDEYKLSLNDFVIKAAALACKKVPECNSAWMGDTIRRHNNVDINVAVNTAEGLFTPIVTNADLKGLASISENVKTLAGKAKEMKLAPEEFMGGTFTVSNLGGFGVSQFCAVINPPQACILAVGGVEERVVSIKGTETPEFEAKNYMTVTLSCDHRVVDGAVGAEWLKHFKKYMESPINLLL